MDKNMSANASAGQLNEHYLEAKQKAVARANAKGRTGSRASAPRTDRLPPGQTVIQRLQVLDLGIQPPFDPATWSLSIEGSVRRPISLTYAQLRELPSVEQTSDFHCVTAWSRYDVHWSGVSFETVCDMVEPDVEAKFVLQFGADGYMTNTPLAEMLDGDCLLAYALDGAPIPREHGAPVRVILPKLYAWKGAKFLNRIVFAPDDTPGFWEARGYHNHGDPWREERFS